MSTVKTYSIGTLTYTMPRLLFVSFWVLGALLSLNLLAYKMVPTLMPILFDQHHVSASTMAILTSSIPSIINVFVCPFISTLSDKTRTRWGRRIPYLAVSTPFVVGIMILIAYEPDIAAFIQRVCLPETGLNQIGTWVLAVLVIVFQLAYLIPGSVVYYVYADVIPKQFIGRFMAASSFLGTGVTFVFNYFVLAPAVDNPKIWFPIIGGLYFFSYLMLCLFVKEGEYPPVDDNINRQDKLIKRIKEHVALYFRECYSFRIYIMLFITTGVTQASTLCRGMFNLLFATKDLGMTPKEFGNTMAIGAVIAAVIVLPMGRIMDKLHPIYIFMVSGFVIIAMNLWGYFFVTDAASFTVVGVAIVVIYAIQSLASGPLLLYLVPREQYGQFASANSLINCSIMFFASMLGGYCTDLFGYRMIFIWDFLLTILATVTLFVVYADWKRAGGKENYVAPLYQSVAHRG